MGIASRVRLYIKRLRHARHERTSQQASSTIPPILIAPGTPLGPITEEASVTSLHVNSIRSSNSPPSARNDGVASPSLRCVPINAQLYHGNNSLRPLGNEATVINVTDNETQQETTVDALRSPQLTKNNVPPPVLFPEQYTPLGVSQYIIAPAGNDDLLIQVHRFVNLGATGFTGPGEVRFNVPNPSYMPTVGRCVLMQSGAHQFIGRVVLRIPAGEEPTHIPFDYSSGQEEALPEIIRPSPPYPPPLSGHHQSTTEASSASQFAEIDLLRTPAYRVGGSFLRPSNLPDALRDDSVQRVPQAFSATRISSVDMAQSIQERRSQASQVTQSANNLDAARTPGQSRADLNDHSVQGVPRSEAQEPEGDEDEEYDPANYQSMTNSLGDLHLQGFSSSREELTTPVSSPKYAAVANSQLCGEPSTTAASPIIIHQHLYRPLPHQPELPSRTHPLMHRSSHYHPKSTERDTRSWFRHPHHARSPGSPASTERGVTWAEHATMIESGGARPATHLPRYGRTIPLPQTPSTGESTLDVRARIPSVSGGEGSV